MPLLIVRNDITHIRADAIVNTANREPLIGAGVDSAVYQAAGRVKLLEARRAIGHLEPGEAAVTPAFDLDAKYIIHVCGTRWKDGKQGEEKILRQCYDNALRLAAEHGCQSVAFPLLATGSYRYPHDLGLRTAVKAFTDFLLKHEITIILAVFGKQSFRLSGRLFPEVQSQVDDDYVEHALAEEYARSSGGRARYKNRNALYQPVPGMIPVMGTDEELEDRLKKIMGESFAKQLKKVSEAKGFTNKEVYYQANLSKQYYSKLLKGQVKPSREKVMALAVALHLDLEETNALMAMAGYAFSPISQTDLVVQEFIRRKDYRVLEIDMKLFDLGLDPLSGEVL